MNREELLNRVKNCTPNLGWNEKYPDLYGKYGRSIGGICDKWEWYEEIPECLRQQGYLPLTDATNEELFEMWANADNYWLNKYKQWYHESQEKSSKLDRFIGECEMKYFGYDEDGYTDKTIDRIFKSIFDVLESK